MLGRVPPQKWQGRQVIELRPENADDWWEVEALFDLCFAPGREALSSYRLRDGIPPVAGLSHVARDETGILAAAIRFWPVRVGGHATLLLGPVAVHPTHQGEGLGGVLIREVGRRRSGSGLGACDVGGRYALLRAVRVFAAQRRDHAAADQPGSCAGSGACARRLGRGAGASHAMDDVRGLKAVPGTPMLGIRRMRCPIS